MADPRWTDEVEIAAARALEESLGENDPLDDAFREDGRRVLAALADLGVLIPPGGEVREEWAHQYKGFGKKWSPALAAASREIAERDADDFRLAFSNTPGVESRVVRRTVHTGPWLPATPPTTETTDG